MAEGRDFLSRWSKRKLEKQDASQGGAAQAEAAPEAGAGDEGEAAGDPDDHPAAGIDIDTLDYNSDFTVFMDKKVPEAIRKRALQKLWLSDPILANVDGLNDYDGDFTDAALVVKGLKQSFDEARRRMLDREAAEKKARDAEVAADEEATSAGEESEESEEGEEGEEEGVPVATGESGEPDATMASGDELEDGDLEG